MIIDLNQEQSELSDAMIRVIRDSQTRAFDVGTVDNFWKVEDVIEKLEEAAAIALMFIDEFGLGRSLFSIILIAINDFYDGGECENACDDVFYKLDELFSEELVWNITGQDYHGKGS